MMLVLLAAGLAGLSLAPPGSFASVRDLVSRALLPAQQTLLAGRAGLASGRDRVAGWFGSSARLAELEKQVAQLREENERYRRELGVLGAQAASADRDQRLLRPGAIDAGVLGRQALAFLADRRLIDRGQLHGVQPESLAVAARLVVDRGDDHRTAIGQRAMVNAGVWGRVVQVGQHTSTVQRLTDTNYRDVVRLGAADGPRGIVEGTGEPLCRVRLIETTVPVAVGDVVLADARDTVAGSLAYGRVVRAERNVGASHWDIWMEPAVPKETPARLSLLQLELNPARVAGKP